MKRLSAHVRSAKIRSAPVRSSRILSVQSLERRQLLAAEFAGSIAGDASSLRPPESPDGLWLALPSSDPVIQGAALDAAVGAPPIAKTIRAIEFETFALDDEALQTWLAESPKTISIPSPDGSFERFAIEPSRIMSPDLAAAFPEIHSFVGTNDDAAGQLRLDISPGRFHAQVLRPGGGGYYVDPYSHGESTFFSSYRAEGLFEVPDFIEDFGALGHHHAHHDGHDHGDDGHRCQCKACLGEVGGVHHDPDQANYTIDSSLAAKDSNLISATLDSAAMARPSGSQLRTYRTAVAATGEYTAFHGGTVADGQAAIVTAINRVSGIYETELSIRLQLVADNQQLVYTDAVSDPYTNNDAFALLDENQDNVDAVIGNANYDLGHVFSTDGGGLASLGSVGINSRKAQGETGLANPINDRFYVDYVAHEIGHQFGGSHTFNGDSGSCSGGNRSGNHAYEPGSGSTIQAYAGICGNDNIQNSSDPYFHSESLRQMIAHVDDVIPNVGVRGATGNAIPQVDGGADHVIPSGTPFELTAVGNDADGDQLTYAWEQRDLGPQRDVNAPDDGQGPLFRSFTPTQDATRTFPRLPDLLAGTTTIGEQLPTTSRDLNFRVTVRDNVVDGGAVNDDDVQLRVVDTGESFAVTTTAQDNWTSRQSETVTWDVAGTDAGQINAGFVDILLSIDGGNTFDINLATATPNDGSQSIVVPDIVTDQARIKVKPSDNVFFAISAANFSIVAPVFANDFGDAPSSYGVTLADDGARHALGSPILGDEIDGEADGVASVAADSDEGDDGLQLTGPLISGETSSWIIRSVGGGELDLFIDFDGNGVFGNDASEIVRQTLVDGNNTIAVAIPDGFDGDLYTRLRLSSAGNLGPTGAAADGEVEDYRLIVLAEPPPQDLGDAPPSYDAGGAAATHALRGPRLGEQVDAETILPDNQATGDGRDDDGVTFSQRLTVGQETSIAVTASEAATLDYFIDFNGDGTFAGSDEVFSTPVIAGTQDVILDVPDDAATGVTYGRFRISSGGVSGAGGFANDGEVEDYQLVIISDRSDISVEDFDSVATPNLPTQWIANGVTNAWQTTTQESDSGANAVFAEDIDSISDSTLDSPPIFVDSTDAILTFEHRYDTEPDFDGGVFEISIDGGNFEDIVDAGGVFLSGGYNADISTEHGNPISGRDAWSGDSIDFVTTSIELPDAAVDNDVVLRWRLGTDSSVAGDGWFVDSIRYDGIDLTADWGDAPADYPTLAEDAGPSHLLGELFLGVLIDAEDDGKPTPLADGDDDANIDDEDGVTQTTPLSFGGNSLQIDASQPGIANVWLDLNGDGEFGLTDEHVVKDVAVDAGPQNLAFDIDEITVGTINARVRLSHQGGLLPTGDAGDGEVEDHVFQSAAVAPQVQSVVINDGQDQRSMVTSITINFDSEVTFDASPDDAFELVRPSDDTTVPVQTQISVIDDRTSIRLTFAASALTNSQGSLLDGDYQLTILGGSMTQSGVAIDADGDGVAGGDRLIDATDGLFRKFGDATGGNEVDVMDFLVFRNTYGAIDGDVNYLDYFDFDANGRIDVSDFLPFRNAYGT